MSTTTALMLLPWLGGAAIAAGPTAATLLVPQARGKVSRQRTFDLTHLGLDLTLLPDDGAVQGTATFTVRRLWPGPMVLDQVDLDIDQVTSAAGDLSWRTVGDTLVVELPDDFGVDQDQDFSVSWRATPDTGLHFRRGGHGSPDAVSEIWSQGEGEDSRYWFPSWDHPGDRFVYDGTVQAPDGWRSITNSGVDLVTYLVMVAAGPYDVVAHADHPEVEVWVPPGTSKEAIARVLDPVPDMMEHFAQRTGVPYAWGPYRQIFVQRFLYTGMENTSATTEHVRMLVDDEVAQTSTWVESVAAHELAHQWFGDLLTCEDWQELWLNEGFATFFAADWMETRLGPESHAAAVEGWLHGASTDARPLVGRFFQGPDAPQNHNVYGKGAAVLHMLRVYLGEAAFWDGMKAYTGAHQHGLVATLDLQRAMESVSGRDLDWFFQQWVELGSVPELTVSRSFAEGRLEVQVQQLIDDSHPRYSLPITLEIGTSDGASGTAVLRREGWLDDDELTLSVELDQEPLWVAFDPDGGILSKLSYSQDPAAWAAQLDSPSPLARRAAVAALGDTDRSEELSARLADPELALAEREAIAKALGEQRTSAPLVAALRDEHDALRRAAATALGKAADSDPASALRRLAERDDNPDVAAAALTSLASLQPDLAVSVARKHLRRLTRQEERGLRGAAARVLGEHGDSSDLPALLDPQAPGRLRNVGLTAAARIAARQEGKAVERLSARVARAAELMLDDLDLRTRQRVIGILGQVGDDSSINRLEAYRRHESVDAVSAAALAAITSIRGRKDVAEVPPGQADARLKAIETRLDELEDDLEDLESPH